MEDGVWRIEDVPSSILVLGKRGILFILSKAVSPPKNLRWIA
jgi:hypothetical protein